MGRRGFLADFGSPEWALSRKACEFDDTTLLDGAISITADEDLDSFYNQVLRNSIRWNAASVLRRLIGRGVSVESLTGYDVAGSRKTTKEIVQMLLDHGWDINARGTPGADAKPFMWHVVHNEDMVRWCLDHGASVRPCNQEPLQDGVITHSQRHCEQVLEEVAAWGSIATFKLLQSKGAPLGWRPLHRAVETATYGMSEGVEEKTRDLFSHKERMDMVRYLIDVVKLDVNALDQPVGPTIPNRNGTPICYIPGSGMLERDTRELTWLLLDRGADPTPAVEMARSCDYPKFIEDVNAWKSERVNTWKCNVQ